MGIKDVSLNCKCTKSLDGYCILDLDFSHLPSSAWSAELSCVYQ